MALTLYALIYLKHSFYKMTGFDLTATYVTQQHIQQWGSTCLVYRGKVKSKCSCDMVAFSHLQTIFFLWKLKTWDGAGGKVLGDFNFSLHDVKVHLIYNKIIKLGKRIKPWMQMWGKTNWELTRQMNTIWGRSSLWLLIKFTYKLS